MSYQQSTFDGCTESKVGLDTPEDVSPSDVPVTIRPVKATTEIGHEAGDYQIGYDTTAFSSSESFEALLTAFDLSRKPLLVDRSGLVEHHEPFEHNVWVWYNEEVVLVTGHDPRTGENANRDMPRHPRDGYCGYIGIEGEEEAARELARNVSRRVDAVARVDGERRFI